MDRFVTLLEELGEDGLDAIFETLAPEWTPLQQEVLLAALAYCGALAQTETMKEDALTITGEDILRRNASERAHPGSGTYPTI